MPLYETGDWEINATVLRSDGWDSTRLKPVFIAGESLETL